MVNEIHDPDFFVGGKAYFTVSNAKDEHYSYRIMRHPDTDGKPPIYYISLLTGSDNRNSYTYIGMYHHKGFQVRHGRKHPWFYIRLTRGSKMNRLSKPVLVFDWAVKQIWKMAKLPDGYAIQHEGKCAACARKLTTPKSIARGFGPGCYEMMMG